MQPTGLLCKCLSNAEMKEKLGIINTWSETIKSKNEMGMISGGKWRVSDAILPPGSLGTVGFINKKPYVEAIGCFPEWGSYRSS